MLYVRTPSDLGALIRERRRKLGLDQAELAERVGVNRKWVIAIESGKPRAALGLVLRTLQVLGLRLLAEDDQARGKPPSLIKASDIDAIVERARKVER